MFDKLEREAQEKELEEKLTSDEMLHDEELALESQREKLESEIDSIKLQLMDNKLLEERKLKGEAVEPRDNVWILKARQALLIKKRQRKRTDKKLAKIKTLLYGGKNEASK